MRKLYKNLPNLATLEDLILWAKDVTRSRVFDVDDYNLQVSNNPFIYDAPSSPTDLLGTEKPGDIAVDSSNLYVVFDNGTTLEWATIPFGGGGGSVDLMPYCATGAGANITGAISTMDISTEQVADANYSLSADQITVATAGIYQISYSLQVDEDGTGGGTRGRITALIENNTVAIEQSYCSVYTREASGGTGISNSFIVSLAASDVIRLRAQSDGNAVVDNSQERAQISIIKVE